MVEMEERSRTYINVYTVPLHSQAYWINTSFWTFCNSKLSLPSLLPLPADQSNNLPKKNRFYKSAKSSSLQNSAKEVLFESQVAQAQFSGQ